MLTRMAISVSGGMVATATFISRYDDPHRPASTQSRASSMPRRGGREAAGNAAALAPVRAASVTRMTSIPASIPGIAGTDITAIGDRYGTAANELLETPPVQSPVCEDWRHRPGILDSPQRIFMHSNSEVSNYYGSGNLLSRLNEALIDDGADPQHPTM